MHGQANKHPRYNLSKNISCRIYLIVRQRRNLGKIPCEVNARKKFSIHKVVPQNTIEKKTEKET